VFKSKSPFHRLLAPAPQFRCRVARTAVSGSMPEVDLFRSLGATSCRRGIVVPWCPPWLFGKHRWKSEKLGTFTENEQHKQQNNVVTYPPVISAGWTLIQVPGDDWPLGKTAGWKSRKPQGDPLVFSGFTSNGCQRLSHCSLGCTHWTN